MNNKRIIIIDNPKRIVPNVQTVTAEDDGSDVPVREYHRVEKRTGSEITEFDGDGQISPQLSSAEGSDGGNHKGTVFYAPKPSCDEPNDMYTLLRNPHIARNEEVIAKPMNADPLRQKHLGHL